jgi:TetR/AcrR family transcriptional regulator, transcriptional repressor for nem operon
VSSAPAPTATRVLDVAERLMQTRGWSAVSYADLAQEVGIRAASIHHHFPSKADLGRALVLRYNRTFEGKLERIDARGGTAPERLADYFAILRDAMGDATRLCLCTMLAAEFTVLPDEMREPITSHVSHNHRWLEETLRAGMRREELLELDDPSAEAQTLFAEGQGAQLLARSFGDVSRFDTVVRSIAHRLVAAAPAPA